MLNHINKNVHTMTNEELYEYVDTNISSEIVAKIDVEQNIILSTEDTYKLNNDIVVLLRGHC